MRLCFMHRFISNHTHIINFCEKKKLSNKKNIETCVSKIRFYVVFGSNRKKESHIHANIFMHISYQHINAHIILCQHIHAHIKLCQHIHACINNLNAQKEKFITCFNHHASCACIIVLFHEMKIFFCHLWDRNLLHSHERLSNLLFRNEETEKDTKFASLMFLGLMVLFIHISSSSNQFGPSPTLHWPSSPVLSGPLSLALSSPQAQFCLVTPSLALSNPQAQLCLALKPSFVQPQAQLCLAPKPNFTLAPQAYFYLAPQAHFSVTQAQFCTGPSSLVLSGHLKPSFVQPLSPVSHQPLNPNFIWPLNPSLVWPKPNFALVP